MTLYVEYHNAALSLIVIKGINDALFAATYSTEDVSGHICFSVSFIAGLVQQNAEYKKVKKSVAQFIAKTTGYDDLPLIIED